jgi:hypothetical protein
VNKYKIKYYYLHEYSEFPYSETGLNYPEYEVIMYDDDEKSVRYKFESKYRHTKVLRIFIEKDGIFQIPGRRRRQNKTTYVPGKGIIHSI